MGNLKISKTIVFVGVILLLVGIVCLFLSITNFIDAIRSYNAAYDRWHDAWWNDHTADLNDKPTPNYFTKIIFIPISFTLIGFSIFLITIGARPYLSKFSQKYKSEISAYTSQESQTTSQQKSTPTTKRECEYCGAKLEKDSSICSYCGKEN